MRRRALLLAALGSLLLAAPGHAALVPEIEWGQPGAGAGQFALPNDVAADAAGNVFVADQDNHRIQKFTADGVFVTAWGGFGEAPGQFDRPAGIDTDEAGNVYVADNGNSRVQVFDGNGAFLRTFGSAGEAPEQFSNTRMWGIAVGSEGIVYAVDSGKNHVKRFTPDGSFLGSFGRKGARPGQFARPRGLGIDEGGNVYVADRDNHRIQKFTAEGRFLFQWGTRGRGEGEFSAPYDVEVDADDNVYVADFGNNRIQRFATNGMFLDQTRLFGLDARAPFQPRGLGADALGQVYVADQFAGVGNRILRFQETGRLPDTVETADSIEQLSDPVPFQEVNVETQGTVVIELGGGGASASQAVPRAPIVLKGAAQLPIGSTIDTTAGRIALESAANNAGAMQTAQFFAGRFQVIQRRARRPITEVVLKGGSFTEACSARRAKGAEANSSQRRRTNRRRVRRVWGNGTGRFRTRGRYSSATVRGTQWLVEDRCDGTLTRVARRPRTNRVVVRDFRRRRNVTLRAGQSYLAAKSRR